MYELLKVKSSKKRALASAYKKHVPEKKAKLITPSKTGAKLTLFFFILCNKIVST